MHDGLMRMNGYAMPPGWDDDCQSLLTPRISLEIVSMSAEGAVNCVADALDDGQMRLGSTESCSKLSDSKCDL